MKIRVRLKNGKIVEKKVDYIQDWTNGPATATSGETAYIAVDRDYDGLIFAKDK